MTNEGEGERTTSWAGRRWAADCPRCRRRCSRARAGGGESSACCTRAGRSACVLLAHTSSGSSSHPSRALVLTRIAALPIAGLSNVKRATQRKPRIAIVLVSCIRERERKRLGASRAIKRLFTRAQDARWAAREATALCSRRSAAVVAATDECRCNGNDGTRRALTRQRLCVGKLPEGSIVPLGGRGHATHHYTTRYNATTTTTYSIVHSNHY